jgi:hypothetical protein
MSVKLIVTTLEELERASGVFIFESTARLSSGGLVRHEICGKYVVAYFNHYRCFVIGVGTTKSY